MSDEAPCAACDDVRAITHLIHEYARLIDSAQFERVAELFRDATWFGNTGYDEVLDWFQTRVILYDGNPRTQHVVTNVDVSIDAGSADATAHSYITVLQQVDPSGPISIITANYYDDTFAKVEGVWRFGSREITRRLVGDMNQHRHP